MKKYLSLFLIVLFILTFTSKEVKAEIPPKAKAFLIVTGYGVGAGALLGFASMAFGTSPRAIAQGASLGLYGGIIFGAYILSSHESAKYPDSYQEYDPYQNVPYSPYGYPAAPQPQPQMQEPPKPSGGGFFDSSNRVLDIHEKWATFEQKKGEVNTPPIYVNFFEALF